MSEPCNSTFLSPHSYSMCHSCHIFYFCMCSKFDVTYCCNFFKNSFKELLKLYTIYILICIFKNLLQFSCCSVVSDSLRPHESQHARPPCPSQTPGVHTDSTSIKSVMPSSHLILCRPLLLLPPIPPSIRVFSNESTLRMRWPKYWSFSFSIIPSKESPGLISSRIDWLDFLAVQGILKSSPTPQFKSINSSALSLLHSPTLTSIHDHWKNHSLDQTDLCWQSNVCFSICYLGWS